MGQQSGDPRTEVKKQKEDARPPDGTMLSLLQTRGIEPLGIYKRLKRYFPEEPLPPASLLQRKTVLCL